MTKTITGSVDQMLQQIYDHGNINRVVLASARHAVSLESPQAQAVWPIIMAGIETPAMVSETFVPKLSITGEPTYAEIATFAAIRLYAIHQQGIDICVYGGAYGDEAVGKLFFKALAQLRLNENIQVALDRRVKALLATTNVTSVINSLTHLVSILKASQQNQQIDYARLAGDLFHFQFSYESANQVRLTWGRQYYSNVESSQTKGEKN